MRQHHPYRTTFWCAFVVAQLAVLSVLILGAIRPTAAQPLRGHEAAMAPMDMAAMVTAQPAPKAVVRLHQRVARVSIQNLSFQPARIVVSRGTRIIWQNEDGFAHTVTSDKGIWFSGDVNSRGQFARVFSKAGVFPYHCSIHPFMHGTIIVQK